MNRDLPPSDFAGLEHRATRDTQVERFMSQLKDAEPRPTLASRIFIVVLALSSPAAIALGIYLANRWVSP